MVNVHADVLACVMDQPESRDNNYIARGNSNLTGRKRYICDVKQIKQCLPSCEKCQRFICAEHEKSKRQGCAPPPLINLKCDRCLNWDFMCGSPNAEFLPDDNHPEFQPGQKMAPKLMRAIDLQDRVVEIHHKISSGEWNVKQGLVVAKYAGLNDKASTEITGRAMKACNLKKSIAGIQEAEDNGLPALECHLDMLLHAERNPEEYQQWPCPAIWRHQALNLFIDAIMHLFFLGVVKTIMKKIQAWLTLQRTNSAFIRKTLDNLDSVAELRLDWIKLQPYKGDKFGSWNSENYMGFSRIMLWAYSEIYSLKKEDTPGPPEHLPVEKWKVDQLEHWLAERGLDIPEGLKAAKVALVEGLIRNNGNRWPPKRVDVMELSVDQVEKPVRYLSDLLSNVMSPTVDYRVIMRTNYAYRVFLSA